MPRPSSISEQPLLDESQLLPLVDGPNISTAINAIVAISNSTVVRRTIMERSGFPLSGDESAFLLLNQLIYRGAARPTDMAESIQTSRSSVTRIVSRMDEAGLIVRTPDPRDDRAMIIGLSESGREVGARVVEQGAEIFRSVVDEWSDEELLFLERLLVKLARSMDRASNQMITQISGAPWLMVDERSAPDDGAA